jgi:predicted Rossmann fold flavoprotein
MGFLHKNIAIIGGGASGMMAALTAASCNSDAVITIYEKNNRVGKKLLSTGNGRCNLTNTECDIGHFHGNNPEFVKAVIERFTPEDTIRFFESIGLECKLTHGGRVFPYCGQASAVLDVLRFELARAGVEIRTNTEVIAVSRDSAAEGLALHLRTSAGDDITRTDRLVVSCGGKSAPSTGSDGGGFSLLSSLGHRIIEPYPALTQLKTDTKIAASLCGVRVTGRASVIGHDSSEIAQSEGEIQFTAYGLSGPAIMDISAAALTGQNDKAVVALDLMPHLSNKGLVKMLALRKERLSHLLSLDFLVGMLHKKVGQVILKHAGVLKLSLPVCELCDSELLRLARLIKRLVFQVEGHTGWEHAQATGGGADTAEFSASTMESLLVSGLFATGEVLDVYGDCGGYNLQWAWSTGRAAGLAATAEVRA